MVLHVLQMLLFAALFAVLHVLLVQLRRLLPAVGRRKMLRRRRRRHKCHDGGVPRRTLLVLRAVLVMLLEVYVVLEL